MIKVSSKGDFRKTYLFLNKKMNWMDRINLDIVCQNGINALREATPKDTGKTANSWSYSIKRDHLFGTMKIMFSNSNINDGAPIAILLRYGHATRDGGWIQGNDYISPALKPVFDRILQLAWEEVTKLV